MIRYQIVYSKRGSSLTLWIDSEESAHRFAEGLREAGYYNVQVWAHTKDGAHMTNL